MPRYTVWIAAEGSPRYSNELECCDGAHAEAEGNVIGDRFNKSATSASGKALSYSVEIDNDVGERIAEIISLSIVRNAA